MTTVYILYLIFIAIVFFFLYGTILRYNVITRRITTLEKNQSDIGTKLVNIDLNSILTRIEKLLGAVPKQVKEEIKRQVDEIDKTCRCPKCQGICIPKSQFCKNCGAKFSEEIVLGRILAFKGGPKLATVFEIRWQCLHSNCMSTQTLEWSDDELEDENYFIHVLVCEDCEETCGEVMITCGENITVSSVHPINTLKAV